MTTIVAIRLGKNNESIMVSRVTYDPNTEAAKQFEEKEGYTGGQIYFNDSDFAEGFVKDFNTTYPGLNAVCEEVPVWL